MLWIGSGNALAQQPLDAGRALDSVQPAPREPRPAPEVVPATPPALPGSGFVVGVVRVSGYRFTGATVYSQDELLRLLRDTIDRELSFQELMQAVARVTHYYRRNGFFLAQAYLPVQEIKQGIVTIDVLEGRVAKVERMIDPSLRLSSTYVDSVLSTIVSGDLIERGRLERPLLLLNDLAGVTASATFRPGVMIGTADVIVSVRATGETVFGSVDVDNWGNRFIGVYRASASVGVNGLARRGDHLSLRGMLAQHDGLRFGRLAYTLPINTVGTRFGASYADMAYRLGEDFESLDAHGQAQAVGLSLTHPFVRRRDMNFAMELGYDAKQLEDRIDSVSSVTEKKSGIWHTAFSGDFRDHWVGGGVNFYSLSVAVGDLDIRTPAARSADASATGRHTDGGFRKYDFGLTRLQHLTDSTSLSLAVTGQFASQNLDSSEKFSLGGPTGVRAYPVGEAAADEGRIVTLEWRWKLPAPVWMPGDKTFVAFADQGTARINDDPLPSDTRNTRRLWGYGLGFIWSRRNDFTVQVNSAWRGNDELSTSDEDKSPRLWMRAVKRF